MSFSEQLKKARLKIGYTQQQVADLMGITKSTYCGYETGKRQPDVPKIKQLAEILNTSGDILLETDFANECNLNYNCIDKNDIIKNSKTFLDIGMSLAKKQILESIDALNDEQVKAVSSFLKYLINDEGK